MLVGVERAHAYRTLHRFDSNSACLQFCLKHRCSHRNITANEQAAQARVSRFRVTQNVITNYSAFLRFNVSLNVSQRVLDDKRRFDKQRDFL